MADTPPISEKKQKTWPFDDDDEVPDSPDLVYLGTRFGDGRSSPESPLKRAYRVSGA